MVVELDSRHPLLPKTGWENEDLTLILREKKWRFLQIQVLSMLGKGKKHENKQNYNG